MAGLKEIGCGIVRSMKIGEEIQWRFLIVKLDIYDSW